MARLAILAAFLLMSLSARAGCAVALEIKPNGAIFTFPPPTRPRR
jgi:hypothetical protein